MKLPCNGNLGNGNSAAYRTAVLAALAAALLSAPCLAQTSSLWQRDLPVTERPPATLGNSSWIRRELPPPKQIQLRDLVTIRIDEQSQAVAEGELQRRKTALYDAVLQDWISLDGLKAIRPNAQSDGDPRARGQLSQLYRSEAELESVESLKFNITAEVVDIRPNGNLVLEARKIIRNNDETWEYSLTGVCRPEDVGPNNLVLSDKVAELHIFKRERGEVRDGYRRGWFTRWFDMIQPF